MQLTHRRLDLQLTHRWTIASSYGPGGSGGTSTYGSVIVELLDRDGVTGLGEAAPSNRYQETPDSIIEFLKRVDATRLTFADVPGSMAYLDSIAPGNFAPKCALNIALLDGAARLAGKPVYDFLGLGFTENKHVTSFSIGIAAPDEIRRKVLEAANYPVLKLKVGSLEDRENIAALRSAAPSKTVRVDGNEAWKTKEEALRNIEWLAHDPHIEFIEQPMPAGTAPADLRWLKERSPLPLMADESYKSAADIDVCAECYHYVNVKLVKAGGISASYEALKAARNAGMKTMIGCMIETSIQITAAAHLAELTDYLDIDGNLLITGDPYRGATAVNGEVSFAETAETVGLRVKPA
jgi:L-Ala-D/L-Glu epimerase